MTRRASSPMAGVGNRLYFIANDAAYGTELWSSDGTPAGTALADDIHPGAGSPQLLDFSAVGQRLMFFAYDQTSDTGLWSYDPANGGTLVLPAGPDRAEVNAGQCVLNGVAYCPFVEGVHGRELWRSDGTAAGTSMVADVNPYGDGIELSPTADPGRVYFAGSDGNGGFEPWVSDGTAAGTQLLKDVNTIDAGSAPIPIAVNGKIIMPATDYRGSQLWVSDGTDAGTTLLKMISPRATASMFDFTVAGKRAFFFTQAAAYHDPRDTGVWVSDGTPDGTQEVLTDDGADIFSLSNPVALGDELYFNVTRSANVVSLWKSDGTAAGTVKVADGLTGPIAFDGQIFCDEPVLRVGPVAVGLRRIDSAARYEQLPPARGRCGKRALLHQGRARV